MNKNKKPLVFVILGPPGAGKGTQSRAIIERYNLNYIATGDLIRELYNLATPLGRVVKANYDKGIPQPDNIVIEAVRNKLFTLDLQKGILFDMFPLSVGQVEALENITKEFDLSLPRVIVLEISSQTILRRLNSRLVCSNCGAVYMPGNGAAYLTRECEKCHGRLIPRLDDKLEVIMRRIKEYDTRLTSLKNYYKKKNRLVVIDGEPPIDQVSQNIFKKLDEITKTNQTKPKTVRELQNCHCERL